jgi:hypothetical protein
MTDTQIALLIQARNKITDQMYPDDVYPDTSAIDALLAAVPLGSNREVDALLGRTYQAERARVEAQRERNATAAPVDGRIVAQAVTLEQIADMQAKCDEQTIDAPQHEGMWK